MYGHKWGAPGSLSCNRATQSNGPIVTIILCSVLCQSAQEQRLPARAPLLWIHTHISSQASLHLQDNITVYRRRYDGTIKIKILSLFTAIEVFVRHVDTLSRSAGILQKVFTRGSKVSEWGKTNVHRSPFDVKNGSKTRKRLSISYRIRRRELAAPFNSPGKLLYLKWKRSNSLSCEICLENL